MVIFCEIRAFEYTEIVDWNKLSSEIRLNQSAQGGVQLFRPMICLFVS